MNSRLTLLAAMSIAAIATHTANTDSYQGGKTGGHGKCRFGSRVAPHKRNRKGKVKRSYDSRKYLTGNK